MGLGRNNVNMKDNTQEYNNACAFRDAAIADGWEHHPTYKLESEDRACSLSKDGWKMMIFTRKLLPKANYYYSVSISIWAPDNLAVQIPDAYNWDKIKNGVNICSECKNNGETFRYGFAGRCCKNCLPKLQEKHEYPGWCD